jgi:hypothetical protein
MASQNSSFSGSSSAQVRSPLYLLAATFLNPRWNSKCETAINQGAFCHRRTLVIGDPNKEWRASVRTATRGILRPRLFVIVGTRPRPRCARRSRTRGEHRRRFPQFVARVGATRRCCSGRCDRQQLATEPSMLRWVRRGSDRSRLVGGMCRWFIVSKSVVVDVSHLQTSLRHAEFFCPWAASTNDPSCSSGCYEPYAPKIGCAL